MDLINYIALFRNLLRRSENLVKNSLQREAKEIALPIINCIVDDIIELLTMCKRKQFILSQNEQWDFQHKFSSHQKYLDELVEELGLVKDALSAIHTFPPRVLIFIPIRTREQAYVRSVELVIARQRSYTTRRK